MPDPKSSVLLVVDSGLFTHIAVALAPHFKRTMYWSDWARSAFPQEKHARIGDGLPDIERVQDVYAAIEDADLIVFPDVVTFQLASYVKKLGKPYFGTTKHASELELNRWDTRKTIKKAGLPVGQAVRIIGADDLSMYLQENNDLYVKYGKFRGDLETFHHQDWFMTQEWFKDTVHHLGPSADDAEFVVETPIPGVEAGVDSFSVDGKWPERIKWGYELKDAGYAGIVVDYGDLPDPLRIVCDKLSPVLREREHRGFISTECRIDEDGVPYLIDPCLRCGSPPSEVMTHVCVNMADVVYQGAHGKLITPEYSGKYTAEVVLKSDFAKENFLALDIPDGVRDRVKLHNHTIINGKDYIVPIGISEIGAAVGCGKTLDEAIGYALGAAGAVKGYELTFNKASFDDLGDIIEDGKRSGLPWS